ncbi:MAG: hypothetical protein A2X25_00400 [Chloroflexi bacterium GWB2_49_20]|nr:MAG: hypothetical protein A2X25_00400 [Chloroflexi bacterium GWB2_49_20]OGN80142.1 MAG: hypothetical protein A2X26_09255 [Chloroflexi bacterium GWC2_49_37]OGN83115.1 MAG: hypothetical protein A2X27_13015 [Chloroflexi bacterium GWD2_49_16]
MAGEKAKNYRDLIVWQSGIQLVKDVYILTGKFTDHEKFGLANQLRRAAVSIPSNIAEGQARGNGGDFRRFLLMAIGSLAEVDTQLVLAVELGYLEPAHAASLDPQITELRMKLYALIKSLPQRV